MQQATVLFGGHFNMSVHCYWGEVVFVRRSVLLGKIAIAVEQATSQTSCNRGPRRLNKQLGELREACILNTVVSKVAIKGHIFPFSENPPFTISEDWQT